MALFAATIFLGSFLLFQVELIIARIILPWFDGAAAVWTTCLLYFQIMLLLGYLYAHGLARYFREKSQFLVHLARAYTRLKRYKVFYLAGPGPMKTGGS